MIYFDNSNVSLSEILTQFTKQNISYTYKENDEIPNSTITLSRNELSLRELLNEIAEKHELSYKIYKEHIIIKQKRKKDHVISGFIYDANTGEHLVGANVFCIDNFKGTSTNNYGFYSFSNVQGVYKVRFSYIGYEPLTKEINSPNNLFLNIYLKPGNVLNEITVKDKNLQLLQKVMGSNHTLERPTFEKQIGSIGEKDVLKVIQLLPGAQPVTEGSTGLQIRGGSHYQNLILIDDVPIYNMDHSFGFYSIFNANAIKQVKLYKGIIPARYGGRISSVVDIRMNEGNLEHFECDFSTGLVLSKIKFEVPVIKHKTGLMVSARHTHLNLPLNVLDENNDNSDNNYSFADIYAKISHKFSARNRVYLSFFYGSDSYKKERNNVPGVENDFQSDLRWKNLATALRWNWLITDKLFCNTTIKYSAYEYSHNTSEKEEQSSVNQNINAKDKNLAYYSKINEFGIKLDFDLQAQKKFFFKFGVNTSMHLYEPFSEGKLVLWTKETNNLFELPVFNVVYDTLVPNTQLKSYSISAYFENDIRFTDKLGVNIGFRYQSYLNDKNIQHSPEPRISVRYLTSQKLSMKLGYSRMSQNVILLSSSFLVLPFNTWVPATENIAPQFSNQVSLSTYYKSDNELFTSVELFYNTIENDIIYNNNIYQDTPWQESVNQGLRRTYGLELMIEKQFGKLSGWVTYTFSKAERKFDNLNDGNYFPYWLVRNHKISTVLNFKLNDFVDFSINWIFSSKIKANSNYQRLSPIIFQEGVDYENPNRDSWSLIKDIPAYHKMDVGVNFHFGKRKFQHLVSLGVNNVYARNNPLLISEFEGYLYLSKINLFMPFVQYSFKFK